MKAYCIKSVSNRALEMIRQHKTSESEYAKDLPSDATAITNFLTDGNTYDNSFSKTYNSNIRLSSYHYGTIRTEHWMPTYVVKGIYQDKDNESESLSGTFSQEQQDMTMEDLKAIYTDGSEQTLKEILNRASTRSDGRTRTSEIQFFPGVYYFIPKTDDRLSNEFGIRYRTTKEDIWKDYNINYGSNPVPTDVRRQYIDNTPHSYLGIQNNLTYSIRIKKFHLSLNYEYFFAEEVKDSYQYALDRLEDVGVFGTLPAGWTSTLDPDNSYVSRTLSNTHSISPSLNYYSGLNKEKNYYLTVDIYPEFSVRHLHLNYIRNDHFYPIRKSFFLTTMGGWDAGVSTYLDAKIDDNHVLRSKHDKRYEKDIGMSQRLLHLYKQRLRNCRNIKGGYPYGDSLLHYEMECKAYA